MPRDESDIHVKRVVGGFWDPGFAVWYMCTKWCVQVHFGTAGWNLAPPLGRAIGRRWVGRLEGSHLNQGVSSFRACTSGVCVSPLFILFVFRDEAHGKMPSSLASGRR